MKRILVSLMVVAIASAVGITATRAYFSDTETSTGNTFTAGTLDLKVDGGDVNVFRTFNNMVPEHSQPNFSWKLKNSGSLTGHLSIKDISITGNENGCLEPETNAGDSTCNTPGPGESELSSVLNYRLMLDVNCDGWNQAGDTIYYQGFANLMGSTYDTGLNLTAGQEVCINSLINWWSTANDNKAQGDDMMANFTFNLQSI